MTEHVAVIASYPALKSSLLDGARSYIASRHKPGWFRGLLSYLDAAEINRANNLIDLVKPLNPSRPQDQLRLLALTSAVFDGPSTHLTQYVSDAMIQGQYSTLNLAAGGNPLETTLWSSVFDSSVLQLFVENPRNLSLTAMADADTIYFLDKAFAVRKLSRLAINTHNQPSKIERETRHLLLQLEAQRADNKSDTASSDTQNKGPR